jgi:predicted nucleic acid-binding protein
VLPFVDIVDIVEIVEIAVEVSGVCRGPDDDKFIACALAASADFIVSGDKDLSDIAKYKAVRIVRAADLLKMTD